MFFANDMCLKIIPQSTEEKLQESKVMEAVCIVNEMRNNHLGELPFVTSTGLVSVSAVVILAPVLIPPSRGVMLQS